MRLKDCKIGTPVKLLSIYHSHPLEGFIIKVEEIQTTHWDRFIPVKSAVICIMLTDGSYMKVYSVSHLKLLKRRNNASI